MNIRVLRSWLRPFRPSWRRFAAAGLAAAALAAAPSFLATAAQPNGAATENAALGSAESLVDTFQHMVFRTGYRAQEPEASIAYVRKWQRPILTRYIRITDKYRAYADKVTGELARLTGLTVKDAPADGSKQPNFVLSYVDPGVVEHLLILYNIEKSMRDQFVKLPCVGIMGQKAGPIVIALLIVKNNLSDAETKHCILEESARALGFRARYVESAASVFSDEGTPPAELTVNDKLLLRALYDQGLPVGANMDDAMAHMRATIPGLVADVQARGADALYQQ